MVITESKLDKLDFWGNSRLLEFRPHWEDLERKGITLQPRGRHSLSKDAS